MAEKRIDWPSMMLFEKEFSQESSAPSRSKSEHEKAEDAVYFQYLEQNERLGTEHDGSEVWHNPLMHVDARLSAQDAFSSLPHWAWFEDTA